MQHYPLHVQFMQTSFGLQKDHFHMKRRHALYAVIYLIVLARMYHVAFFLEAGDPRRYLDLAATAPNTQDFLAHYYSNFDPLYWFFLYFVGYLSSDLLIPVSAFLFSMGFISVWRQIRCSELVAIVAIILIMAPFNTMGNFIGGALRQTFAMSLMMIAIFNDFSSRYKYFLIACAIFSHISMVIVFIGYIVYRYFKLFRRLMSSGRISRMALFGGALLLLSIFILSHELINIFENKVNQYSGITARENIRFGIDKMGFIALHVLTMLYSHSKATEQSKKLGWLVGIVYSQSLFLIPVDFSIAVRVFNSVYYLSVIYFCCVFLPNIKRLRRF